jgi:Holliday junction resolvase
MTSNNYQRGASLERDVLQALKVHYPLAIRSAGSHGVVDVVAVGIDHVLLVQCKRNGRLDPAEWNELWDLAQETQGIPVLADRPPRKAIRYWMLTGPKEPGARGRSPRVPFSIAG